MSFAIVAIKTGQLFRENSGQLADIQVDRGIAEAQSAALSAIRGKTPTRTGLLRSTVVARGEMLKRSVVASAAHSVPVDQGYVPASKRRYAVGKRIKGGKKKFLAAARIKGHQFFYATFQGIKATLTAQYLAPVGAAIVRALDKR